MATDSAPMTAPVVASLMAVVEAAAVASMVFTALINDVGADRMDAMAADGVASNMPALDDDMAAGNTKGGSITRPLTSCLTGLD